MLRVFLSCLLSRGSRSKVGLGAGFYLANHLILVLKNSHEKLTDFKLHKKKKKKNSYIDLWY